MMNDHEVEIYVQNESETHVSGGVYSVMHNKWLQKPKKEDVIINLVTHVVVGSQVLAYIIKNVKILYIKNQP